LIQGGYHLPQLQFHLSQSGTERIFGFAWHKLPHYLPDHRIKLQVRNIRFSNENQLILGTVTVSMYQLAVGVLIEYNILIKRRVYAEFAP
jgi:hypothetical protein